MFLFVQFDDDGDIELATEDFAEVTGKVTVYQAVGEFTPLEDESDEDEDF